MTYSICHVKELISPARPFVEIKIGHRASRALYDSGADISCISDKEFRKIPVEQRPSKGAEDRPRKYLGAGGHQLDVRGVFTLQVDILGRKVSHPFRVIRGLHEPVILGADFINSQCLGYDPCKREVGWAGPDPAYTQMQVSSAMAIPEFSSRLVPARTQLKQNSHVVAEIFCQDQPHLMGGPGLVELDQEGRCLVEIMNTGPEPIQLSRGQVIGSGEVLPINRIQKIDPEAVAAITRAAAAREESDQTRIKILKEKLKLEVPKEFEQRYVNLLTKHHAAFSLDKTDIGLCNLVKHKLVMKTPEPVFVKQFKIPEAHQHYLIEQVREWLKLGIIQPSRSKYNSPLFLVQKKDGSYRVVQDFRLLNAHTYVDKYSMKDVAECISDIGKSGSTIFTTIDLTSGFWQMALDAESRKYTAFTIPSVGQFEWRVVSMGIASAPGGYQRLVELVMKGLDQVLVYIDDIIVHSASHEEHLQRLDQVLERLSRHNLKANLAKCSFGASETTYLGFRLTKDGIVPGSDKLKAVKEAQPPTTVRQVRQFLGLCNFFRGHIQHFAQLTAPLTELTKKDSTWKRGSLPTEALRAFRHLQSLLCSEPVLAYPRKDRTYALITDASFGDGNVSGGLGAILTQVDKQGNFYVIGYASRKLQKHEVNYTPFLLEMQAAIFGMETFGFNLKGRHFFLFTDHKPLEKLGKVHTKTLNRLQEMMTHFDFEIIYKKGSEMPADFLSRNAVDSIGMNLDEFAQEQSKDEFLNQLRLYLLNRVLPKNDSISKIIMRTADSCFVQNGVVWKRLDKNHNFRPCLYAPSHLKEKIISDAHGQELSGHFGLLKTKEQILNSYFWPNMEADISNHLRSCQKCQKILPNRNAPQLLTPLPLPTEPNQRVHADLFGPLKCEDGSKKYVLCMTDAFSKLVELVVIPNKEAGTVACAILNRWICRYGVPLEIVTDMGLEFKNKLFAEISRLIGTKHSTTSAYHSQCNSQAEVCNKTIAKYLASMVDSSTLNWEQFIPALMFCYNSSFHRSIKTSPFFLTFGFEPRSPSFFATDIRLFLKEDHNSALQRLAEARKIAIENNWVATEAYKENFDKKAKDYEYHVGQFVLLDEFNFLNKNRKLASKFAGPFQIIRLKGNNNAEIVVNNGRKMIVNFQRLRPFCGDIPIAAQKNNQPVFPEGGRDPVVVTTEADRLSQSGENVVTPTPSHSHSLTPQGPSSGPLTRARAKIAAQTKKIYQIEMLDDLLDRLDSEILAIKKRSNRKKLRRLFEQADPYKYGEGLEAGDSDGPAVDPGPAPAIDNNDGISDDDDDVDVGEGDDQPQSDSSENYDDADDESEEKGDDHEWVETPDGWKAWVRSPAGKIAIKPADFIWGHKQLDDPALTRLLANKGQSLREFQKALVEEQHNFDYDFKQATKKPVVSDAEVQHLQTLRDRGMRLRRLFSKVQSATTPDGLRHRTPATPRSPDFRLEATPVQRQRGPTSGLHGRRIRFDDEDEGPIASRTRWRRPTADDDSDDS